jgi:hypothetical protein
MRIQKTIKCYFVCLALFGFISIGSVSNVWGAIINAKSCTETDILAAIASASNGDRVNVPPGNCTWTTKVDISKEIAIVGSGIGATNITMGNTTAYFYPVPGTDNWRISGFSFRTNSSSNAALKVGLYKSHESFNFRVDHCEFKGFHYGLIVSGNCTGVIDHNSILGGGIMVIGHNQYAWTKDANLGSSDFVFVEDNTFNNFGELERVLHVMYGGLGARIVFRYNTIQETGPNGIADAVDAHGYCHGEDCRGTRIYEIYKNRFVRAVNGCCRALFLRGGSGVVFENTFDESGGQYRQYEYHSQIYLFDYRAAKMGTGMSKCALGNQAPLCPADTGGEGYPCYDQIGRGKDQAIEPYYFWGNVDHNGNEVKPVVDASVADYIKINRDYYISQKAGYTPYKYPHPLVTAENLLQPPRQLRIVSMQ